MKQIDIEKLLVWTYRDELPKHEFQPWDMITAIGELMTGSDDGRPSTGDRYAALYQGGPHPDAYLVHEAVKALDGISVMPMIEEPEALLSDMPAEVQAEAERALASYRVNLSQLVMANAGKRSRPEWRAEPPARKPLINQKTGKPFWFIEREFPGIFGARLSQELIVAVDPRTRRPPAGAYRKYQWQPDPFFIVAARADYACWRAALAFLAEELKGALKEHEAIGPEAAAWPWEEGEREAPRIVPSLVAPEDFTSRAARPHPAPRVRRSKASAVRSVEEAS